MSTLQATPFGKPSAATMIAKVIILLFVFSLVSCSQDHYVLKSRTTAPEQEAVDECRSLVDLTERTIAKADVIDAQEARIKDFPYLRVTRFLSSFRNEIEAQTFESWLGQLQNLGVSGWEIELNNLPLRYRTDLARQTAGLLPETPSLVSKLANCGKTLSHFELNQAVKSEEIKQQAVVPSEYNTWQQIAGFYPLTAVVFRLGIYNWHRETLKTFKKPLSSLPVQGELIRYAPGNNIRKLSRVNVSEILQKASNNPLRIPMPSKLDQQLLFESFAPVFEIDRVSKNDEIGAPYWTDFDKISIDIEKSVVYRQISHTRFASRTLLQLNYTVWFPSRPKSSKLDLLGGHLDGIIWRVTLGPDGNPLIFDSIHLCGCYHFFFPTQYARLSESQALFREPAFAPQSRFAFDDNQNVIIRIGASNHYIQRIYSDAAAGKSVRRYRFDDADSLRSLALPNGQSRSLYDQNGFVTGSERGERFLFWPMGIPNPGAMRQWGHHATAFVGRRHFDEAHLFEGVIEQAERLQ